MLSMGDFHPAVLDFIPFVLFVLWAGANAKGYCLASEVLFLTMFVGFIGLGVALLSVALYLPGAVTLASFVDITIILEYESEKPNGRQACGVH